MPGCKEAPQAPPHVVGKQVGYPGPPICVAVTCSVQGGGEDAVAKIGKKNAEKSGKKAENAAKNAIENAVLLEWCLPLETPMFRPVLHNWAPKAWTV